MKTNKVAITAIFVICAASPMVYILLTANWITPAPLLLGVLPIAALCIGACLVLDEIQ